MALSAFVVLARRTHDTVIVEEQVHSPGTIYSWNLTRYKVRFWDGCDGPMGVVDGDTYLLPAGTPLFRPLADNPSTATLRITRRWAASTIYTLILPDGATVQLHPVTPFAAIDCQ